MDMKLGKRSNTSPKIYGVVIEPVVIWNKKIGMSYHIQFGHSYVCLEIKSDR